MTDQATFNQQAKGGVFCANCCFYDALFGTTTDGQEVPPTVGGVCRKNAPTQVFDQTGLRVLQEAHSISEPRPGVWPLIAPHDWCGDHPLRQAGAIITREDLVTDMRAKMKELAKLKRQAERQAEGRGVAQGPRPPRTS